MYNQITAALLTAKEFLLLQKASAVSQSCTHNARTSRSPRTDLMLAKRAPRVCRASLTSGSRVHASFITFAHLFSQGALVNRLFFVIH